MGGVVYIKCLFVRSILCRFYFLLKKLYLMLYNRVMEKRYQVFISSTYSDLQEERGKVMQAVMSRIVYLQEWNYFQPLMKNNLILLKGLLMTVVII